jgi:hypothetical protein
MMKRVVYLACAAAVLLAAFAEADAGNQERIGTAAAQELRIPVGSRGTALGGAALANVRGLEAMYWNPAGLVLGETKREVTFSYLDYMADMNMNYFAISTKVRDDISIGLSAKVLSVGDIIVTTEQNPEGTGEILTPTFSIISATFSQQWTDRVIFGMTAKYIHEGIKREVASGLAFDFGFQYVTGLKALKLGVAMRNFGPDIKFDGPDLERSVSLSDAVPSADPNATSRFFRTPLAAAELPTSIELGMSYDLVENETGKAVFSAAFRSNNLAADEYQAGVEYEFRKTLSLRGGYAASPEGDVTPSGFKKQYILGPSFGFGLNLPLGTTSIKVDYAVGQTEFFQDNHWLTVSMGF